MMHSKSNNLWKAAFREAVSLEFKDIPKDEELIHHCFSDKFERNMQKLITAASKNKLHVRIYHKRFAILVAVLSLLFITILSVSAIREPIVNILTEAYETFTEFFFEGNTTDEINSEYIVSYIPEGFEEVDKYVESICISTTYKDSSGRKIELTQDITDGIAFSLDAEKGDTKKINISGKTVHLYTQKDFACAIWTEGQYLFTLTYDGEHDKEELYSIIASVKEAG